MVNDSNKLTKRQVLEIRISQLNKLINKNIKVNCRLDIYKPDRTMYKLSMDKRVYKNIAYNESHDLTGWVEYPQITDIVNSMINLLSVMNGNKEEMLNNIKAELEKELKKE